MMREGEDFESSVAGKTFFSQIHYARNALIGCAGIGSRRGGMVKEL